MGTGQSSMGTFARSVRMAPPESTACGDNRPRLSGGPGCIGPRGPGDTPLLIGSLIASNPVFATVRQKIFHRSFIARHSFTTNP